MRIFIFCLSLLFFGVCSCAFAAPSEAELAAFAVAEERFGGSLL